jgi:outer membrane protein OmpA-like peptidoglycan-associated protein
MRFDVVRVSMLVAAAGMVGGMILASAPAGATELQVIQGVPSAGQLEDALAPRQPASTVKFRGITLGNQPPKAPSPGTPAAAAGAAPAQPAPTTQATAAIALSINFDFNSDRLTPQGLQVLDNLGQALKSERLKSQRFMLEGHTDGKGADEYNQKLSERRAIAAMEYLIARHGIDPARLSFAGKGKREPLDPANPDAALNRRVQIMNLGS